MKKIVQEVSDEGFEGAVVKNEILTLGFLFFLNLPSDGRVITSNGVLNCGAFNSSYADALTID